MPIDPLTGRAIPAVRPQTFSQFPRDPRERRPDSLPVGIKDPDDEFGNGFKLFDEIPLLDDIVLAAPRGIEGLIRGAGELVDLIPGVETNLSENRFLGRSSTIVGSLLETGTQIMIPFSVAAKLGRGVMLFKGGAQAASAAAGQSAARAGLTAAAGGFGRFAGAGAVADFVAFGGQEARVSDLLQNLPGVQQPVFEYLASDQSDSEFEGRIKNVLEGLGLGFAFDTVFGLVRGVKTARKVAQEQGVEAGRKAAEASAAEIGPKAAEGVRDVFKMIDAEKAAATKAPKKEARKLIKDLLPEPDPNRLNVREALAAGMDPSKIAIDQLGFRPFTVAAEAKRFDEMFDANSGHIVKRLGGDPQKMSTEAKALYMMAEDGLNLTQFARSFDVEEPLVLVRVLERMYQDVNKGIRRNRMTEFEMVASGQGIANDLVSAGRGDAAAMDGAFRAMDQLVEKTDDILPALMGVQTALGSTAGFTSKLLRGRKQLLAEGSGLQSGLTPSDIVNLGLERGTLDEVEDLIVHQSSLLGKLTNTLTQSASNIGRALRARQVPFSTDLLELLEGPAEGVAKRLRQHIGDPEFERWVNMLEVAGETGPLNRISMLERLGEMSRLDKFTVFATDVFINGLLNSAKTVSTNGLFPFLKGFWVPMERMAGAGAMKLAGKGDEVAGVVTEAMSQIVGQFQAMSEAARAGVAAFKRGGGLIDPSQSFREDVGANTRLFSDEVFGAVVHKNLGPGTFGGAFINTVGQLNSFGSRGIAAADEFNKVMVARGFMSAKLQTQALANGIEDVTGHVTAGLDKLIEGGRLLTEERITSKVDRLLLEEGIADKAVRSQRRTELLQQERANANFDELNPISVSALEEARDITETAPFHEKYERAALAGQELINGNPLLKIVFPFYRTPIRLLKSAIQRTPFDISVPRVLFDKISGGTGALEKSRLRNVRDFYSKDPDKVAAAAGRFSTGFGGFTAFGFAANQGLITGAGPNDFEQRRLLMDAGWLPYSIQIPGKGYVQYLRGDPLSIQVGLAADLIETSKLAYYADDEGENTAIVIGIASAIANNVTDRTYLAGLNKFVGALTDPERNATSFLGNLAGGFIPVIGSRGFDQLGDLMADDPVMRDAHGILQRIRRRVAFMGQLNNPVRNVLGEPVRRVTGLSPAAGGVGDKDSPANLFFDFFMPVAYREVTDDTIKREFATLQHGFSPPRRKKFGVRLDEFEVNGRDAYDRWLELHGEVKIQGRSLRQELKRLIKDGRYQELPIEGSISNPSPRVRLLRGVIDRYRARSFEAMLKEFPDLKDEVGRAQQEQARIRGGLPSDSLVGVQPPFRAFAELQQ